MAHYKKIQAVKIYLKGTFADNAELGISGNCIMLSEEPISGWTDGLIAINGIGDISASADLAIGGNVSQVQGLNVNLIHTNQYLLTLKDLGIYLPGCKCEIWEFSGTEANPSAEYSKVIYTGEVEDMTWNEVNLSIPIKNANYKRNADMSIPLRDGSSEIAPITFGRLFPEDPLVINSLAKFIRSNDIQDEFIYTNKYFTGSYEETKIFPIDLVHNETEFRIKTRAAVSIVGGAVSDCYVIIISGEGNGQIREVTYFQAVDPGISDLAIVTISAVFYTVPCAVDTDPNKKRSWVQFLEIKRDFINDVWPGKDFLQSANGEAIIANTAPEIYTYNSDSESYDKIADFGLVVKDTNNNALDIDGSQYTDNIDNVDGFVIMPTTGISLETDGDLENVFPLESYVSLFKVADGLYSNLNQPVSHVIGYDYSDLTKDKNSISYGYITASAQFTGSSAQRKYCAALNFGLPALPKGIDIDSVSIGIRAHDNNATSKITIGMKRFAYTTSVDYKQFSRNAAGSDPNLDSLPDFYYSDTVATNDLNFYRATEASGGFWSNIFGYKTFELSGVDKNVYNSFKNGIIYVEIPCPTSAAYSNILKIYELAIIFKVANTSIKKEVYSPAAGRIFNGTWPRIYTSTDLIQSPKDIIEHCKRLQNYSDLNGTIVNWGKAYSPDALIKIGAGEGSFDDSVLNPLIGYYPAFQIFDAAKANTDYIVKHLCRSYGACSRINATGYEELYGLDRTNPTEIITFADLNGDIGDVIEPKMQDVFCEPVFNYQYNVASGQYDKQLKIYNIDAYTAGGLWSNSCSGFAGQADAEPILALCAALYAKVKHIEPCPSGFSDQFTVRDYQSAIALLQRRIEWLGKSRISLSVFYDKGKDYHEFKHVLIRLPHQTKNYDIECIIESITKSKNSNKVSLNLIILDDISLSWNDSNISGPEYQNNEAVGDEIQDRSN